MVGIGRWGPDVQREYISRWHDRAEVDRVRDARGLTAWVRHDVLSESDFRRTAYFREFCVPIGFYDSSGAIHRFADGEKVLLHFTSARPGTFKPGGRTFRVLQLLQPALAASASILRAPSRADAVSSDKVVPPIALATLDGRLLHATPALAALMSDRENGLAVRQLISSLCVETGRLLRARPGDARFVPHRTLVLPGGRGRLTASATIVDHLSNTGTPSCLVIISRSDPSGMTSVPAMDGLSKRELEVAHLLASGLRNREVAESLGVSEHTARRHTERVLRKLGVTSRSAVAALLHRQA